MCVAIFKPANTHIPKDVFEQCFQANGHGAGFALGAVDGEGKPFLLHEKGFFTFADFWAAWEKLPDVDRFEGLIHFRIATHGSQTKENCHPFMFRADNMDWGVIHNGTFGHFGTLGAKHDKSDTRMFVERVIAPLAKFNPDFMEDRKVVEYLDKRMNWNKVVIYRADGKFLILNEGAGDWIELEKGGGEVWFSNKGWKHVTVKGKGAAATGATCALPPADTSAWSDEQLMMAYGYGSDDNDTEGDTVALRGEDTGADESQEDFEQWARKFRPERKDAKDVRVNTVFSGVRAAKLGYPFDPSVGPFFTRGFMATIEQHKNKSAAFDDGYEAGYVGTRRVENNKPEIQRLWDMGYEWGQYETFMDALEQQENKDNGDKAALKEYKKALNAMVPTEVKECTTNCVWGGTVLEACPRCRGVDEPGSLGVENKMAHAANVAALRAANEKKA